MKHFAIQSADLAQSSISVFPRQFHGRVGLLTRAGVALALGSVISLLATPSIHASSLRSDEGAIETTGKPGPARAVRLSSVEGAVQVVQNGQVIADPATANLPLFEGTRVITGNDGRAEIELQDGNVARLSPNSTLTLSVLKPEGSGTHAEIVVNAGLAYLELQPSTSEHSLRVNYGEASFTASSFTVARITLDQAPGELAVFSGNVHLERGDALQVDIHGGESLTLAVSDPGKYNVAENIEPDSWDSWNSDRDQLLNSQAAERTPASEAAGLSQEPGASDLDANGNWYNVPGQGYVWSPYEAQSAGLDFDPYGYGSWVSYPGYGYIWNSGYSWGYAPFQCGLWNFYDNFGWGWAPGRGCNPWWDGGLGGWGYNLGNYPRGYRPPRRPLPIHPRPRVAIGNIHLTSVPVVPVDRRPPEKTGIVMNGGRNEPVSIAGHLVHPIAPIAPRSTYERTANGFAAGTGRLSTGSGNMYVPGGSHPVYVPGQPIRSGQAGPSAYRPAQSSNSSAARSTASSGFGGGGHASAPSGGGGGGGHASGGGGGGGGGSHK